MPTIACKPGPPSSGTRKRTEGRRGGLTVGVRVAWDNTSKEVTAPAAGRFPFGVAVEAAGNGVTNVAGWLDSRWDIDQLIGKARGKLDPERFPLRVGQITADPISDPCQSGSIQLRRHPTWCRLHGRTDRFAFRLIKLRNRR